MKKILFLSSILAALVLSSCSEDYLDNPKLGNTGDTSTYYEGDDAAEAALVTCYYYIKQPSRKETNEFFLSHLKVSGKLGGELSGTSVIAEQGSLDHYLHDGLNCSGNQKLWNVYWKVIEACNIVTDHFSDATPVQKRCAAEAKVLKAWAYINLASYWGNAPLIKSVPTGPADPNFKPANAAEEDIWTYAKECLTEAIESGVLPQKKGADDKVVRVTKETALTLLGKAQVFTGDYAGAKTSLKQVIDSPNYRLLTTEELRTVLCAGGAGRLNSESLMEIYNDIEAGDKYQSVFYDYFDPNWVMDAHEIGWVSEDSYIRRIAYGWPTYVDYQAIKDIIDHEGLSKRVKAFFVSYDELVDEWGLKHIEQNLDPVADADTYNLLQRTSLSTPSTEFITSDLKYQVLGFCGFLFRKPMSTYIDDWFDHANEKYSRSANYRSLLRLSEAYLLYAEACAMAGDSDGSGLKALNAIARRAGYAKGAGEYSSLTLENVKIEKRAEMFGEGCRFVDLVRWGDAEKVLKAEPYLPIFFGYNDGKSSADIKPDGSNLWDVYKMRFFDVDANSEIKPSGFVKGTHEHLPFPYSEITTNPNLVQNPGYAF